jgi:hypothetical protein
LGEGRKIDGRKIEEKRKRKAVVKWTLKSLFVLIAVVAVHMPILGIGCGWSFASLVLTARRTSDPGLATLAAIIAPIVAGSLVGGVNASAAFARTPPAVSADGGFEDIVSGGTLGAFAGLVIGIFVVVIYLAIAIPWSLRIRN